MKTTMDEATIKKIVEESVKKILEVANYSHDLTSSEFDDYTFLAKRNTGLPYDIYVDSEFAYKTYHHPLCLYVIINDKPIPVKLGYHPEVIWGKIPKFSAIKNFIRRNYVHLLDYANFRISSPEFYERLDRTLSEETLNEYGRVSPEKTNLPVWVWIDETQSFKRSPHQNSYRMKFQQDEDVTSTHFWMPLLLPSLKVHKSKKIPPCKLTDSQVNSVKEWAILNMESLLLLRDAKISGDEFMKEHMKSLPGVKVKRTHVDNVPSYKIISDNQHGYMIVKSDDGKYNFIDENGILLNEDVWYDKVVHFNLIENIPTAYGLVGDEWKKITKPQKQR